MKFLQQKSCFFKFSFSISECSVFLIEHFFHIFVFINQQTWKWTTDQAKPPWWRISSWTRSHTARSSWGKSLIITIQKLISNLWGKYKAYQYHDSDVRKILYKILMNIGWTKQKQPITDHFSSCSKHSQAHLTCFIKSKNYWAMPSNF